MNGLPLGFVWYFLHTQIKVCFQKQTTEVECHLFPSLQCTYYYHLKVHTINLISLRLLILITWLRYCLSGLCFVVIIFSPFSKCSLWKETTVPGRHLQRGNLCPIFFKLSMYIIYLECCKWILLILPHLFVYSIICLYKCRLRDMYFMLKIIIQYYVINFVKTASGLAFEGSFCWLQASLVAQLVKTLPAVQETQVRIPGWKDPLEKEMATTPVILPGISLWHIPVSVFMCVCMCVYYFFVFWYYKCSRLILHIFCPIYKCSEEPWFLSLENHIGLAKKFVLVFYNISWKIRMNILVNPKIENNIWALVNRSRRY